MFVVLKLSTLESLPTFIRLPQLVITHIHLSLCQLSLYSWSYEFKASMLEIYNETINDLLYEGKPECAPKHEIKLVKEGSKEV